MEQDEAVAKTDELIGLILQHQEDALGKVPLADDERARQAAQAIATFRQTLITQLTQQP